MSKEERALWDAAASLLDRNQSFVPKDASPASVRVVKMGPECNKMPEERQHKKEAA